jgi:type IV pilus assembly protein PilC
MRKNMSLYKYKAKNLQGHEIEGSLEAQNEHHLAQLLKQQGYFLISSQNTEIGSQKTNKNKQFFVSSLNKIGFLSSLFGVSLTEKLFFTRNLEVMVKSGISLVRAFDISAAQSRSKKFKNALTDIAQRINKGESLSQALGYYPNIFPLLFQETIRVGEETGNLAESLRALSDQMEKEHSLKSKVKSAMVYPLIVLIITLLMAIFMLIFAVPKLKATFQELGVELPLTTKAVLGLADFATQKWPLFLLCVIIFAAALLVFLKSKIGKKIQAILFLKMPFLAKITRQTNSAIVLRTLSSLLKAGVPIVRSLIITSGSVNNFYFKQALQASAREIEKGEKLSVALGAFQKIFSPMVIQMIEVGEETGETPQVLSKLAEFLEEEASQSTQKISVIIEPLLILFLGGIVGFFVISMMQPMYSILGGIH